ncbi:tRNA pseudouridine(38-40) synthase TruA [Desulfolithobacter sp.]
MSGEERNIRLCLAYDGTGYSGWQRQPEGRTIQATVEACLERMTGEKVTLHGAGRTDAGVHALGMVANFHTRTSIPVHGLWRGLNSMLPADIRILKALEADPKFHSRYSATGKAYRYDLYTGPVQQPTRRLYETHVPSHFALEPVLRCLALLRGSHDFSSFEASGSRNPACTNGRGAVRTLFHCSCTPGTEPENWSFRFLGDGFLRHMVRNLVGTLLLVARGQMTTDEFSTILQARDRNLAGPTAPARGLFLEQVFYGPLP